MTLPFLDPHLAASKPDRKRRHKATDLKASASTDRAREKAINDTMAEFIAAMDEETLPAFFLALERLATSANSKRIATHPLHPAIVDQLHAAADEEEALAALAPEVATAAEAKECGADRAREAEAPAVEAGVLNTTPQPGAQDGAALN